MEERQGRMLADLVPAERMALRAAWAVSVLGDEASTSRVARVLGTERNRARGMLRLAQMDGLVRMVGRTTRKRGSLIRLSNAYWRVVTRE